MRSSEIQGDPSFYIRGSSKSVAMITLALDDLLIVRTFLKLVKSVKSKLPDRFEMEDYGVEKSI